MLRRVGIIVAFLVGSLVGAIVCVIWVRGHRWQSINVSATTARPIVGSDKGYEGLTFLDVARRRGWPDAYGTGRQVGVMGQNGRTDPVEPEPGFWFRYCDSRGSCLYLRFDGPAPRVVEQESGMLIQ